MREIQWSSENEVFIAKSMRSIGICFSLLKDSSGR